MVANGSTGEDAEMGRVMLVNNVGRRAACIGGMTTLLAALTACSGGVDRSAGSASSRGQGTDSVTASAEPTATPTVPQWRPPSEISQTPDLPTRGIQPVSGASGKQVEMYGLTLTVPEESSIREWTNDRGSPMTSVMLAGADEEFPYLVVSHVDSSGNTLEQESYLQETLLAGPGREDTYVARTPETWPVGSEMADAYMLTWTHDEPQADGTSVTTDRAALLVADGPTGRWRIIAAAQPGELTEDSIAWQAMLTATIDRP
ncbi:hypothetical protein SAMN05216355_101617 [Actinomyces ruminicola]|uniref:Lipoprotein LpqN n=2 Tax=Actinomyces ruminicola TaxID=332524 RepID=A0A1H0A7Z2_9ACTO|nr:hypothetical protein SAMN05216355_101617 [Actinomyces ruminicola]